MLALDTNVIARYLLDDDANQSRLSADVLLKYTQRGALYLSPFMLMELVWLLKAKGLEKHEIVPIIEKLVQTDGILVGQKNVVVSAINIFRKRNLSFTDCLIAADGDINANANTATFDQAMIKANIRCKPVEECLKED